ncbi:MAG TPA: carbon-nitrogen hydrolase family protein [Halanaerobiales bacterium]|nr:carbon-nitrogen hydrolase family protein [Halanaerobiales bacterium]
MKNNKNQLKVALIQMKVIDDKDKNLVKAKDFVKKAADQEAELVMLPEMFNCPYQTIKFPEYAEKEGGKSWRFLSELAKENDIFLVGGSIPEKDDKNDTYNTSYVFNNKGEQIAKHRKVHLFDIDIEGGQTFKESDTLSAGNNITVFDTPYGKMGLVICYDLRFPELSALLSKKGVKYILVPGAFNMTTGPAHWELLFRSRALDNQVYTLGAAPARDSKQPYVSYGNSIAVSPWGKVIKRLGGGEDILITDLDLDYLDKIREELPLLKHKREDIYDG